MSTKTKIVVLRRKELLYTGIFIVLGILFLVLLVKFLLPGKEENTGGDATPAGAEPLYIPGIYAAELELSGQSVAVEVIVTAEEISEIRLGDLNDAVTTMYPLLQPTFASICTQVYETQSPEGISYPADSKYTSLVLLQTIRTALDKARITPAPSPGPEISPLPSPGSSPAAQPAPAGIRP